MNLYQKLQCARVALQEKNLKKSGNNKFAGYTYFELGDFLVEINKLCKEYKIFTRTSFTEDIATLTIINSENPEEQIEFTSPMAEANLKGCHAIQNIGAVETYQRRYLLMLAFEIVENDGLEATTGANNAKKSANLSAAQVNRLYVIANKKGYSKQDVEALVNKKYNSPANKLTKAQYDEVVAGYESLEDR